MNRRSFLSMLGVGAAAIAAIGAPRDTPRPKKFGMFDVLPDGTLSLGGQTLFPVYGMNGGLTYTCISYKLVNGKPVCSDPRYELPA